MAPDTKTPHSGGSLWVKDLTQDGDVEANPGPHHTKAKAHRKSLPQGRSRGFYEPSSSSQPKPVLQGFYEPSLQPSDSATPNSHLPPQDRTLVMGDGTWPVLCQTLFLMAYISKHVPPASNPQPMGPPQATGVVCSISKDPSTTDPGQTFSLPPTGGSEDQSSTVPVATGMVWSQASPSPSRGGTHEGGGARGTLIKSESLP